MPKTIEHLDQRIKGDYPIGDSVSFYQTKREFPVGMSPDDVAREMWYAHNTAMAREDEALERRSGMHHASHLLLNRTTASTTLPEARAGAAVTCEAFLDYCHKKKVEPEKVLRAHGIREHDVTAVREYSSAMNRAIGKAEKADPAAKNRQAPTWKTAMGLKTI